MRKISVGTFPLIDIDKKERRYIETYLINVLSDLISVNQLSSSIYDDRAKFITPMSILEFFKNNSMGFNTNKEPSGSSMESERNIKARVIKNAFKNTRDLYRAISNDPFFKNQIFYPIYIEESIKANNGGYSDYKYDFLVLSNDLIKTQLLDEIVFDDKITMLFLVLKDILYPKTKLNMIGLDKESENIRKYFSIYLETCKNENVSPFDLFIKIIKFAGNNRQSSSGLFNMISGKDPRNQSSRLKSFANLFGKDGEVKDASFLISRTQDEIHDFLKDVAKNERQTFNPIERQYQQAKTHEYSKVLSLIDALISFNKQNNVTEEINANTMIAKLKTHDDRDLSINIDQILNDLETIYFRNFLEKIKKDDWKVINVINNYVKSKFDVNIYDLYNDEQKRFKEYNRAKESLISLEKEIKTINFKLKRAYDDPTIDQNALRNELDIAQNNYNEANNIVLANQDYFTRNPQDDTKIKEKIVGELRADLGMDLELVKAQLTAIYTELYTYYYSSDFKEDIVLKDFNINNITNPINQNLTNLKMSLGELAKTFEEQYQNNISNFIINNLARFENSKLSKIRGDQINLRDLNDFPFNEIGLIKSIFSMVLEPIHKKFGNPTIMDSVKIKNLRTEKNPMLRKLLSNNGIFKAFIINEETILGAYDILHYLDTLKYEVGIINNPVSNVHNMANKITFISNRLGLNENPVFVIGKSNITLSMPDHLSFSGQKFTTTVRISDFLKVTNINFSKELWSHQNMFGGTENSMEYKELAKSIKNITNDINNINTKIKNEKDKAKREKLQKDLKFKQNDQKIKQETLNNMRTLSNSKNFGPNLDPSKRNDFERTWNQPRPGGNYATNMDQNGNYNYVNDRIHQNQMDMDRLSNQNFIPRDDSIFNNRYVQNRNSQFRNPNLSVGDNNV